MPNLLFEIDTAVFKNHNMDDKNSQKNIITFSIELLLEASKAMNVKLVQIGISILKFLLEVIDGPCHEN
jgi:hypothetical protein